MKNCIFSEVKIPINYQISFIVEICILHSKYPEMYCSAAGTNKSACPWLWDNAFMPSLWPEHTCIATRQEWHDCCPHT